MVFAEFINNVKTGNPTLSTEHHKASIILMIWLITGLPTFKATQ